MNEIEQIIEEKIWERHEDCKIKPDEYKEYPEECCYRHCAKSIEQYIIKARIEECQDWLDYFKAQDDDQRIYLLENHFEKRIAKLKKDLQGDK